ncbi:MAG: hypothetical protein R6X35_14835 [Candidatus Krumholzibacteriia bacterium]
MSAFGPAARPGTGRPASRRAVLPALLVLLVAGVLWAPLLRQAERSVFARVPVLDEVWYLDRAAALQGLAPPADEPHFMSPLYPVLIKLTGGAGGVPADRVVPPAQLRGLRLLQIACWAGTVLLLRVLAGRLLAPDAPGRRLLVWLPPLLLALYRPAAVYAMAVLVELPLAFLLTLALALVLAVPDRRRPVVWAAGAGLVLGAAGLLRGSALVLVPAAAAWVATRPGARRRQAGAALAIAAVAVLLPASLHNTRLAGRPAGPTLNGGVNLVIGNGPAANGFYVAVIDGDWRRDPAGTEQLAGASGRDRVGLAEADRLWTDRALQTMAARPLRTAGLWLKKVWLHLQGWEIDQLTPLAGWTATVPLLRVLVVPWALLVVLALAGAADLLARGRPGPWLVPLAAGALLLAVQSVFFVVSRYRLALVPVLALLAAAGLAALLRRRRPALVAVPLALLLVVPWGLDGVRDRWQAMGLANAALRHADLALATGDGAGLARAEELYRAALDRGAAGEAPWLGLAAVLEARGDPDGAGRVLADGLVALGRAPGLHGKLAAGALAAGDPVAAEPHLRAVLELRPRDADALHNLAVLRGGRGAPADLAAAEDLARRLVAAHPDDPRGWNDLGILLARTGRSVEAAAVFRQGLARVPGDPDLAANLERLAPAE